jgi:mannose-6-phosphate isomerase-like protein (cupin superfamily)
MRIFGGPNGRSPAASFYLNDGGTVEMDNLSVGRRVVRWLVRILLTIIVAVIGLIVSDNLHKRTCREQNLKGLVVDFPGERLVFLETGWQNNGQALSMDTVREPFKDPDFRLKREDGHIHPDQEERFDIIEGSARFLIGDREVVLTAGQTAVVPPNTVHHWMALGGQPVRVKAEYKPALDTGVLFYRLYGPLERSEINLLQAMVIQREYRGAVWPAYPHPVLWKMLAMTLAPIGRLLGYKAC